MRKIAQNIIIIIVAFMISFILVEVFIRVVGTTDEYGQWYFMERPLRPYVIPYAELRGTIERIKARIEDHTLPLDTRCFFGLGNLPHR